MDPNTLNRPKYLLHISYAFFSNIKHAKRSFKKKKKKKIQEENSNQATSMNFFFFEITIETNFFNTTMFVFLLTK